jgi:hypothetical protein
MPQHNQNLYNRINFIFSIDLIDMGTIGLNIEDENLASGGSISNVGARVSL